MSPTRFADVNASSSAVFKETNFMSTVSRGSSALRPGDLYTPRSQCCPSSLVHADHSAWAKSVVELGLLLATLTHLYVTWPRPETVHASPLADRSPPPGGGVCGYHHAVRHYAHRASRREEPGSSPDCQGFPASGGH